MPKVFLPAISGLQSSAIAEALRSSGWDVAGSSRSDAGDARQRAAGAELLVLTIPQDHRPGAMTAFVDHWVEAAQSGKVQRIVLNLGGTPGPAEVNPFFADLHAAVDRVTGSGLPYVILRPTIYFDNLAAPWARDALTNGMIVYPAAPDVAVSWLSHRTLGAWVAAVARGAADGRTIAIGGPDALTGEQLARQIGQGLGRDLHYVPLALADFAQGINAAMGPPAGHRLAAIYEWLGQNPESMTVNPSEAGQFGVTLEPAAAFAARVLAPA
jgi:uncharacterized protein YbjT (DUF2867 family)